MILITGGSGLLGANLTVEALKIGTKVTSLYHEYKPYIPGVDWRQCDLTDTDSALMLIRSCRPSSIIHCAALTNLDECESEPGLANRLNVDASRTVALAAREIGSKLVYISTDSVFDGERGNYNEEDRPRPINHYAKSKLAGEIAVTETLDTAMVIRTNFYGWNAKDKQSLAEWIIGRLESRKDVPGFADVIFNPLLVNHLARIILDMLNQRLKGLYHVGGTDTCSKYEFARDLATAFELDPSEIHPVSIDDSDLTTPRPKNTSLDNSKVIADLGRTLPGFKAGFKRLKETRGSNFVQTIKSTETTTEQE